MSTDYGANSSVGDGINSGGLTRFWEGRDLTDVAPGQTDYSNNVANNTANDVLVGASMPNVLIEAGFLSNKNETKLLGQSRYRQKIAQAIFSALVNFKDKYENPLIGEN